MLHTHSHMRMTTLGQFFRDVGTATRSPEVRTAVRQAGKVVEQQLEKELVRGLQRFADGFATARSPSPVNLGTPTASPADRDYVTGLYRDLLGRAPDADGLRAHLAGLAGGMSREQIRQVFLTSPEYLAKTSAPAPTVTPAPVTPPVVAPEQKTGVEQLKQLIDADMKTAFGRPATDGDYAYWLPMLQSPCDSGFVTSGQMTGVEYYHRRMLGWQAGGTDQATSGPYAGSPEANGPVPSAVDVVGPLS